MSIIQRFRFRCLRMINPARQVIAITANISTVIESPIIQKIRVIPGAV
jgi:hypothetical protein